MVDFGGISVKELTQALKDGLLDEDLVRQALASGSNPLATMADLGIGENVLINGGFRFAQRQAPGTLTTYNKPGTGAFDWAYGADRWFMCNENASIQYKRFDTRGTGAAVVEANLLSRYYGKFKKITSGGKILVGQFIKTNNCIHMQGRTVRFQVKMKRTIASSMKVRLGLLIPTTPDGPDQYTGGTAVLLTAWGANGTDPTWDGSTLVAQTPILPENGVVNGLGMDCDLTSAWVRYSASFDLAAETDLRGVLPVIWADADLAVNDELNITEAALTVGAGIPTWTPRNEELELQMVQHYCAKSFETDNAPVTQGGYGVVGSNPIPFMWGTTSAGAAKSHSPTCFYPVRMRSNRADSPPDVTFYNPEDNDNEVAQISEGSCNITGQFTGYTGFIVICNGQGSGDVGDTFAVHYLADADKFW